MEGVRNTEGFTYGYPCYDLQAIKPNRMCVFIFYLHEPATRCPKDSHTGSRG